MVPPQAVWPVSERFTSNSLLNEATKFLLQSWRFKSAQSYNSQFCKWAVWCAEVSCNPVSGLASDVANFLADTLWGAIPGKFPEFLQICHFFHPWSGWRCANILWFAVYWKGPLILGHHSTLYRHVECTKSPSVLRTHMAIYFPITQDSHLQAYNAAGIH